MVISTSNLEKLLYQMYRSLYPCIQQRTHLLVHLMSAHTVVCVSVCVYQYAVNDRSIIFLTTRWPVTAQRPVKQGRKKRSLRETTTARSGCLSFIKPNKALCNMLIETGDTTQIHHRGSQWHTSVLLYVCVYVCMHVLYACMYSMCLGLLSVTYCFCQIENLDKLRLSTSAILRIVILYNLLYYEILSC